MPNMTAADVAAFFTSRGLEVPAEVMAVTANETADTARNTILEHMVPFDTEDAKARKARETDGSAWQAELFDLAERYARMFKSEVNNVGRGKARQTKLTIETPEGTFFLRLSKTI